MVTNRAADSRTAGVSVCRVLLLGGTTYLAVDGAGGDCGCSRAADSCACFRPCAQERVARYFRSLCVYAESALFGIAADGGGICRGGAQLGRGRGAGCDVLCDLSPGDLR